MDKFELLAQMLKKEGIIQTQMKIARQDHPGGECRLSFEQQRIWFIQMFDPQSHAYNDPTAIRIRGKLDSGILQKALAEIVRRHETLRTVFADRDGTPVQVVKEFSGIELEITGSGDDMGISDETRIRSLVNELSACVFDLSKGPLVKCHLLVCGKDDHVLLVNMHHIISDGWSKGILARELMQLYESFNKGNPSSLPELPIQYSDYAAWQEEFVSQPGFRQQLDFWKKALDGAPPVLDLPLDFPRPGIQSSRGSYIPFRFSAAELKALNQLANDNGVSLFMLMLAFFQVLLYRYTSQSDFVVGTPIAGRRFQECEGLIGVFINTLPLRAVIKGDMRFSSFLEEIKTGAIAAFENQDIPFEKLVEELNPRRDMSHTPIFQVLFTMQNMPVPRMEMEGLSLSVMAIDSGFSQFDLSLTLGEDEGCLSGTFEYNSDMFLPGKIEAMVRHYWKIIDSLLADARMLISAIPLLAREEEEELVILGNAPEAAEKPGQSLTGLFNSQAALHPDRRAISSAEGAITYSRLNEEANCLAHHLVSLGVQQESIVAICLDNSPLLITAILGVIKAGGAYLPLDPHYPQARIASILKDSAPALIITAREFAVFLNDLPAPVIRLDEIRETLLSYPADNPATKISSSNLVCVIYTSGTTGNPRGVMLEHDNLVNLVHSFNESYAVTPDDVILPLTSIASASFAGEIFPALCSGASLVLLDRLSLLDFDTLAAAIVNNRVSILSTVPSMLARLNAEDIAFPTLRLLLSGGESLSPGDIDNLLKRITVVNGYGITETSICSTYYIIRAGSRPDSMTGIPVGKPIRNTRIFILDENQNMVPVGVHGGIYIAGDGVSRGYLNDTGLTEKKYITLSIAGEKLRAFCSGDKGCFLPDGNIVYLGRSDSQVQIRGFRIETGEIESVLSMYPVVKECVVIAREDQPGDKYLAAYLVLNNPDDVYNTQELREWLGTRIPEYMIPAQYIRMQQLPLTGNGKVDIESLPAARERPDTGHEYIPPVTETGQLIAGIWKELLHIDKVGIYDNFFDLGGHSLLIVQVHNRLKRNFDKAITIIDLFRYPTVSSLEEFLTAGEKDLLQVDKVRERARMRKMNISQQQRNRQGKNDE